MKGRQIRIGAVAGLLVVVLVACAPSFPSTAKLRTAALGPLVRLDWDAATEPDAGQTVARYRIDVNGTQVALVNAPALSCVLTGLSPSTTYSIAISAYDSNNEWSGTDPDLTKSYTTPATGGAGSTKSCVPTTDTDGDRIPNALETNTGTYVSAADTGTSPTNSDTDGDAIRDGDEVLGTTGGLNLNALGARATKKDLLFEFDWFNDNLDPGVCAAHSHRPTATAIGKLTTAFANSPMTNPDGTTGVKVIADYGQGGAFTGGTLVADADGVINGGVNDPEFAAIKAARFAANRQHYFHYVLNPHRYITPFGSSSSGQAEINGNDLVVSLYCYGSDTNVANTIMHEVGHNLGLFHGGDASARNDKPNYNSIMNYEFQFPGIDSNCVPGGDGNLDYSRGTRASLNESALSETAGLCNGVDVDWNHSGSINSGTVPADINPWYSNYFGGDGFLQTLTDFNDWTHINFGGLSQADGASVKAPEIVTEQPVPH